MPRRSARPQPDRTLELTTHTRDLPRLRPRLWAANKPQRTVVTLDGLVRLRLQVRSCRNPDCPRRGACLRPEQEGRFALPQHEFGLDVIALVGRLRHAEHRSVPEIHAELARRGVPICPRSVGNLLDRYDELLALSLLGRRAAAADHRRGRPGDPGHRRPAARRRPRGPLGAPRRALSGEVLLARSLLSSTQDDLAKLLGEVKAALAVPIAGVVSDGQDSIRKAVEEGPRRRAPSTLPVPLPPRGGQAGLRGGPPRQGPAEEESPRHPADRAEGRGPARMPRPRTIRGYCAAVRSALTDDGRPPLEASGLKLRDRLAKVAASLDRVGGKKGLPKELTPAAGDPGARAWRRPRRCGRTCGWPSAGCTGAAAVLAQQDGGWTPPAVRRRYRGLIAAMARHRGAAGGLAEAFDHFRKVTRSYWPGLFRCYDVADLPRTNNDLEQFFGSYRYHERRCQRPEGGLPGDGGAGLGAAGGGGRDPAAADRGGGPGRRPTCRPGGTCAAAGAAAGGADAGPPLPPRPGGLPAIA